MKYEVLWYHEATEQLFELTVLNSRQARRVMIAVRGAGMGQRADLKKLAGSDEWRLRVGDWRVILLFAAPRLYVSEVHNRRDAY